MAIVTDQATFDALFNASRDPRLAALQELKTPEGFPDIGARTAAAQALHEVGLIVNEGVDISGMDPFLFMRWLASLQFVWFQAMFQQYAPSLLDYQNAAKAWPGSIKISLDDGDYKPFTTPAPPIDHSSPIGPLALADPETYNVTNAFWKNGSPAYKEGQASTPFLSPKGATLYARYISSGLFNFWAWRTA